MNNTFRFHPTLGGPKHVNVTCKFNWSNVDGTLAPSERRVLGLRKGGAYTRGNDTHYRDYTASVV